MPLTPTQVARRANVSVQSVRNWTNDYAEFLSPAARGETGTRLFDNEDVDTLCTIAALRKSGVPPAEVAARLRSGAPTVIDAEPQAAPQKPTDAPHDAIMSHQVQSMLVARLEAVERTQAVLLRAAVLWGALLGAIVALAAAGFVLWVLYLVG